MKLLLNSGLLSVEKNGKEKIYSLMLEQAIKLIKELLSSLEEDILLENGAEFLNRDNERRNTEMER